MLFRFFSVPGKRRDFYLYIITIVLSGLFIVVGNRIATKDAIMFQDYDQRIVATAKVTDVISRNTSIMAWGGTEYESVLILFRAVITTGRWKDSAVMATQLNEPIYPVQLREVEPGDRVLLTFIDQENGTSGWILQEYNRIGPLIALGLVFVFFSLVFGHSKGFSTIVTLTYTCLALFMIFIPSILSGHNIYLVTYVICLYTIAMTVTLVNGFNQKSLAAGIGCLSGLIVSGILFAIMDKFLMLSGYVDEESVYLMSLDTPTPIDLKAIIFASIIIGAMGAIMDVSVSIASSLSEIHETTGGDIGYLSIIRSGINIGRDIMGTMSNTLILAYVGSSLSLVLLLVVYSNSLTELLNREMIVVELLQALVGSLGLLITIPLTSLIFGYFVHLRQRDKAVPTVSEGVENTIES